MLALELQGPMCMLDQPLSIDSTVSTNFTLESKTPLMRLGVAYETYLDLHASPQA